MNRKEFLDNVAYVAAMVLPDKEINTIQDIKNTIEAVTDALIEADRRFCKAEEDDE